MTDRFLIKFLFLGLNVAKVTTFRFFFSFSLMFCSVICFQYRRNEYAHLNKVACNAFLIYMYMGTRILTTGTEKRQVNRNIYS